MWTDFVKTWLAEHERTQAWLARKAVMSDSQLNHLLMGRHKPGNRILVRLERAMEVEPGTLTALRLQATLLMQETGNGNAD